MAGPVCPVLCKESSSIQQVTQHPMLCLFMTHEALSEAWVIETTAGASTGKSFVVRLWMWPLYLLATGEKYSSQLSQSLASLRLSWRKDVPTGKAGEVIQGSLSSETPSVPGHYKLWEPGGCGGGKKGVGGFLWLLHQLSWAAILTPAIPSKSRFAGWGHSPPKTTIASNVSL